MTTLIDRVSLFLFKPPISNLRRRLNIAGLVLLILSPAFFLAGHGYLQMRKDLTSTRLMHRQSAAHLLAIALEGKIQGVMDLGTTLASNPLFKMMVKRGDWQSALHLVRNVTHDFPHVESVLIVDSKGTLKAGYPMKHATLGRVLTSTEWYRHVSENKLPYLSRIYNAGESDRNVTACAIPILDSGRYLGILVMRIPAEALTDWTKEVNTASAGRVFVVDQDGTPAGQGTPPASQALSNFSTSEPVKRVMRGEHGVMRVHDPSGQDYLVTYEPIPQAGWAVLVEQSSKEVFAERDRALIFLLLLYGLLFLASGVLAYCVLLIFKALQKNKEDLSEFIDHMSTMCAKVGPDGRILMINRIAEIASGLPRSELKITNFLEGPWWTFDPEVQARVKASFERALKGEKIQYDEKLMFAGIEPVIIDFSLTPVKGPSGQVRYVLAEGHDITPLTQAKEALAHAQSVARLGNWEWNTASHRLTWSAEFTHILGLPENESHMEWEKFSTLHPEEAGFLLERMQKCTEKQEPFSCNRLIHLKNGVLRWVRWSGEAFFDSGNKMVRLAGTIQDITTFKLAEEQRMQLIEEQQRRAGAEKDRQRSQFLAQAALLLSSTLDSEATLQRLGRVLTLRFSDWCALYLIQGENDLYRAFATRDSLANGETLPQGQRIYWTEVGEPVVRAIRDEKSELFADINETARTTFLRDPVHDDFSKAFGFESAMIVPLIVRGHALGAIEFVRGGKTERYDDDDLVLAEELSHYAAVAVENARLYTEALRARERAHTLAAIVESSEDAIIGKTLEGIITSWNRGAENMYGYTASEMVGRPISVLAPPDRVNEIAEILDGLKRGDAIQNLETVRARKDGTLLDVSLVISPIRDESGKLVGASSIARDISEKKRYEEGLAKTRDFALESARIKSEFVANVSHEIRTPMNAIIGMMSLLLSGKLTPQQRDYVETVRTSSDALLTIINDILDFSKMEAGKMRLEIQDFDFPTVLDNAIEFLAPRAHFKGLELLSKIAHDVPMAVRGDPGRISQILMNLIGNAIKFTDSGEVVVRVSKKEEKNQNITVRVAVSDTGVGIPKERLKLLFQPFSQVDNSVSRRHGGTGLGLALSKRLVELMGGDIGVDSLPGQGSTFWFQFTLEKQKGANSTPIKQPVLSEYRALVVSGSPTVREVVTHMMMPWGLGQLDTAGNGEEALTRLNQETDQGKPFNVVFIDRNLAREDGLVLAKQIKSASKLPKLRIVMMTSLDQPIDSTMSRESGVMTCLIKPFRLPALLASVTGKPPVEEKPVVDMKPAPVAKGRKKRPHLLVVEDNSINQKVMLLQLEQLGCTADAVANGIEAIRAWEQIPYDIILMDCQMPEMDGYTASQTIRSREAEGHHVPIVAMTAHVMVGDREKCLRAGMDDYIPKPIKTEHLQAMLAKWHPSLAAAHAQTATKSDPLNNPDFVRQVSTLFVKETPTHLKAMKKALRAKDGTGLKNQAHSLAGSCMIVGTQPIKNICRLIESLVEKKQLSEIGKVLKKLDTEFRLFKKSVDSATGGKNHEDTYR